MNTQQKHIKDCLEKLPNSVSSFEAFSRAQLIRLACELVNAAYSNRAHRAIVEASLTKETASGILSLPINTTLKETK